MPSGTVYRLQKRPKTTRNDQKWSEKSKIFEILNLELLSFQNGSLLFKKFLTHFMVC